MFSLFPKDKKFYVLFNDLSANLVEITTEFESFLKDYSNNSPPAKGTADLIATSVSLKRIIDLDRKGDDLSEQLLKELFSTFVTPMDREDVHGLTKTLTSIIEHVTGAARRFDMYNISTVHAPAIELTQVLIKCVTEVQSLVNRIDNLSSLEKFTPVIDQLNLHEKEGDRIYRKAIKEMFLHEQDPLEVIKWKDIYDRLENAIDKCYAAGTIMLGMILKYA
jgi:uncharacterized protein Yka (UPF0111/DUF47 family)